MTQLLSQLWHKATEVGAWLASLPEQFLDLRDGLINFCEEAKTFYNVTSGALSWIDGLRSFWGGLLDAAKNRFAMLTESELGLMVNGKWSSLLALFETNGSVQAFFDPVTGTLTQAGAGLVDFVESFTVFEDFQALVDAAYKSLVNRDLTMLLAALSVFDGSETGLDGAELNKVLFGATPSEEPVEVLDAASA